MKALTGLFTIVLAVVLVGSNAQTKEQPKSGKTDDEYKKEIEEALDPKPTKIEVGTAIPGLTRIELVYEGEKALGLKWLKIESMQSTRKDPRTFILATTMSGKDEVKVLQITFDASGKIVVNRKFDEDKEKTAQVEKRCLELKKVFDKVFP